MLCTTHMEVGEGDGNARHVLEECKKVVARSMTHSFNMNTAYMNSADSVGLDRMALVNVFGESLLHTNIRMVQKKEGSM